MQHSDFKHPHTRWHFITVLERTNNLVFMHATTAKDKDKSIIFNEEAKARLNWGKNINTLYDYRISFGIGDVYERLFQLCVISLCSDIELFFKKTFEVFKYEKNDKSRGFYQRFNDVIKALKAAGHDFSPIEDKLSKINLAFQVRHICIHNYGIVDESFQNNTNTGKLGETYAIEQEQFREMYDAYIDLLVHLDKHLPSIT
ncbi:hypothetical protein [Pseudomonas hunanensis]|uniref:Uncharacterized protein n=1 Tax=Pseudomonas hunanensis TaxID=1247546 RepID=A0ACC9MXE9_9PSED|nr:hypothetical protein [Pseudomonas hunanensis]PKF23680.1 hypothetical protein CW309_26045 [Pseudomonas hunanensis]